MKVKYYTQNELEKEKEKARNEARRDTIDFMLMVSAWAMWDTLTITPDEIKEVLNAMQTKATFVSDKTVSVSDIHEMLRDETGIEISYSKERMR